MKSLGDRMKNNYENVSRNYLLRRTPAIIRVDGKAFHTYTREFDKPFDGKLINAMVYAARAVAEEAQGFKLAYIQSNEASFLLQDYATLETEAWFQYNIAKLVSITASIMSVHFNFFMDDVGVNTHAYFDSRAFNIPKEEIANYFLFRQKDWERNSLNMYAQSCFSHNQLMNKSKDQVQEMLHQIGKNWTADLDCQIKNGTYLIKRDDSIVQITDVMPTYNNISQLLNEIGE